MKEILVQYALYNLWANQQFVTILHNMDSELADREITSSFKTIKHTLRHLKDVEWIWWQRMKLVESIIVEDKEQTLEEIGKDLLQYSQQWVDWVEKSTVAAFEHEFVYRNNKKEQFKQPTFQMLIHLFNHQTYHRGQMVVLLRQLGVEKFTSTDFITWSRKHLKN